MSSGGLILFGLFLAAANVLGGLPVVRSQKLPHRDPRVLKYLIALGAGFMLAAIFIEMLPESVRLWSTGATPDEASHGVATALTLFLGGYLLIHLFEHTIAPHFHFGAETHSEHLLHSGAAYTVIGALAIHSFFDGVSIAAAFIVDYNAGLLVFFAILLHKAPEGFTAASIMLAAKSTARGAFIATLVIGLATLLGVISVAAAQVGLHDSVRYALPFSAGVTLYVAASDLIPEVNRHEEKNPLVSVVVFGGVALYYLAHLLFEM